MRYLSDNDLRKRNSSYETANGYELVRVRKGHGKLVDADEIIASLSVDPYECTGCPEPEFLQDMISVLAEAPSAIKEGV